jgi:hypothetical protein
MRSLYPYHQAPGPPNGGPLFAHNGRPITKAHVVEALQNAVLALGHTDLRISGHSLRATCTSNLVTAGFQERFIKRYGRWTSEAWASYVRQDPHAHHAPAVHDAPIERDVLHYLGL